MKANDISLGIILFSFIIGAFAYSYAPDIIPTHWNAQGEIDGYMDKFWGLFLLPIISFGLFALFVYVPKYDPRKKNLELFKDYYQGIILVTIGFLFYIYILSIMAAFGYKFNMVQMMSPAFGGLFYYMGTALEKTKSNFFVGIRTPWTISDETVWEKTHKIGGTLFKASGVIAVFGAFFKEIAIMLIIAPILAVSVFSIVYSYLEYKKIHKGE
ncbi:MAG: hypothetical protein APG12_01720 [Candidatus Methanofastidiosum methylothiophilum]|uniref:DUF1648 domain-containing protein n=1 Tax=Candidatus Methanofastidiosum methylothiophilum TaxID=1705564 RepID=A0A150IPG0_9EURY|nr:MAG: hypothetical protein APG10_01729 [Candidatus Methanofastidiosum methylthiophilus]KYC46847.1 MAG: hypothetical protein APG11_01645 [Candidatus Methanofastidiosum methylthiophilus]KYC49009.1 MAG: hypothetical protein APG12_01720 [Candidatus Methanofastidiosum methylthiophilus]